MSFCFFATEVSSVCTCLPIQLFALSTCVQLSRSSLQALAQEKEEKHHSAAHWMTSFFPSLCVCGCVFQGVRRGDSRGAGWGERIDVMESVLLQMFTSDLLTTPNNAFFYLKYGVGLTVCSE